MREPLLWICEGGKCSLVARRRLANLRSQEDKWSPFLHLVVIPQIFSEVESRVVCIKKLLFQKLSWGLRLAQHEDSLILITQDDVQLCGRFILELATLLDVAPEGWRSMHLCPGYMWGRMQNKPRLDRELPDVVRADPEWVVSKWAVVNDRLARLFQPAWVGGPLAFLIRRRGIASLLRQLQATSESLPDDMSLVFIATPDDYMLRKDLLCHEREQGRSQNSSYIMGRVVAISLAVLCGGTIYVAVFAKLTPEAKARTIIFLFMLICLVCFGVKTFKHQSLPSSQSASAVTDETPTRRQFLQQCRQTRLKLCERCSACPQDLPDPADTAAWLGAIEKLWKSGGCLRVSSTRHHFSLDKDLQSTKIGNAGLAFCAPSLSEPAERFSLLPCFLGPRHVAMRHVFSLANCAISNGVRDREYLLSLPESVLCECLTGERRLPSTDTLRQECLADIHAHVGCCAVV